MFGATIEIDFDIPEYQGAPRWQLASSFPTTTPTTIATRSPWAACSPFPAPSFSLAYVRHSQGGALEEKEAEDLLARGAESVGAPEMPRHVVVNPGTSVGLAELAERESADVIVFGSEYRTAPGTVKPGIPAHKLLLGGPAAIAVAPAGLRDNPSVSINTIGVIAEGDPAASQTAESLATALGASVAERAGAGHIDLLVVGSRAESPAGKVTLSAASDYAVETASFPVLVVPRDKPISFAAAQPRTA